MNVRYVRVLCGLVLAMTSLLAMRASPAPAAVAAAATAPSLDPGVEEIFILHSLREESTGPSGLCDPAKIGFTAVGQGHFSFWAVLTQAPDGRIVDTHTHKAGLLHGCFEAITSQADGGFYPEAEFNGIHATGRGKCTPIARDLPEPGITSVRCYLILSGLPAPYVGGVLPTNSVASRNAVGDSSDPPGYTQPSIATVRLWRRR